ncbi:MAG TPA: hypothetical protein VFP30_06025 [Candidatus Limnocylindria bacterium]|nr:hypothetical protein [Candidatus Limnocylindria bacterium]
MRYLVLGAILLISTAGTARADGGLTGAVANAFLVRTVDSGLHDIAHARVAELAADGQLSHDGMRPGTAEVLALNQGVSNPVANAVGQWIGSSFHRGILSDGSYGRIGCAELVSDGIHWFACVLATGPLPARAAPAVALPDTGLARPFALPAGARWSAVPE